jgi:toxin HigB-1
MIASFRHKGLKKLFEKGISSGIQSEHVDRVRRILALLETSNSISDMDLSGLNLHELKGNRKGTWAVRVSGNWRITFRVEDGDVHLVDYEDYH